MGRRHRPQASDFQSLTLRGVHANVVRHQTLVKLRTDAGCQCQWHNGWVPGPGGEPAACPVAGHAPNWPQAPDPSTRSNLMMLEPCSHCAEPVPMLWLDGLLRICSGCTKLYDALERDEPGAVAALNAKYRPQRRADGEVR